MLEFIDLFAVSQIPKSQTESDAEGGGGSVSDLDTSISNGATEILTF